MRRTKEEALATRSRILDAAERLFAVHGVSRTSLHDIAAAAGVTRGAVYWHFAGKGELFEAMLDRVTLPLEDQAGARATDPLEAVRARFLAALQATAGDARTRRVFDIALHKAELTGELRALRTRRRRARAAWLTDMERALRLAQRAGLIARRRARPSALGLLALVEGLIAHWLLEPRAFDLVAIGTQALDAYLEGLAPRIARAAGRKPARAPAARARPVNAARRS